MLSLPPKSLRFAAAQVGREPVQQRKRRPWRRKRNALDAHVRFLISRFLMSRFLALRSLARHFWMPRFPARHSPMPRFLVPRSMSQPGRRPAFPSAFWPVGSRHAAPRRFACRASSWRSRPAPCSAHASRHALAVRAPALPVSAHAHRVCWKNAEDCERHGLAGAPHPPCDAPGASSRNNAHRTRR